jgi:hypothetical protein
MRREFDHTAPLSEETTGLGLSSQDQGPQEDLVEGRSNGWPKRPLVFPDLMTPIEAAMFLRLDQTEHSPQSACRTLNYWRDQGDLKATKYARRVWFLRAELERFLKNKTEQK